MDEEENKKRNDAVRKNEVEEILLEAGKTVGRSEEQMKPLIHKIVIDNWIDTKHALMSLSSDQWRDLQVPIRLVNEVQRLIALPTSCSISVQDSNQQVHDIKPPKLQIKKAERDNFEDEYLTAVDYEPPSSTSLPFSLSAATTKLREFVQSHPDQTATTLSILLRLIDGVLRNPTDPAKRRIRLANETFRTRVFQFDQAMEFLKAAGFQIIESYLDLPTAFIPRLVDCRQVLATLMIELGLVIPPLQIRGISIANPQLAPLVQPGPMNQLYQARIAQNAAVDDEIIKTKKLLKTGGVTIPIPLNAKVVHQSALGRLEEAINEANAMDQEYMQMKGDQSGLSLEDIKRVTQTLGEGPQFKSRAKEQLELLLKKEVYSKCVLRIQFPDRFVLQLEFAPATKMVDVDIAIEQFLDPKVVGHQWHIYQSPPPRRFSPKRSLFDENLVPAAVVYFKVDSPNPPNLPYIASRFLPQETLSPSAARPSALQTVLTTDSVSSPSKHSTNGNSSTVSVPGSPSSVFNNKSLIKQEPLGRAKGDDDCPPPSS